MIQKLIAELAEPQGEPVAWMNDDDGDIVPNMDGNIDMSRHGWIPLYARPDPRVAELQSKVCLLQQNDLATVMLRRRVEKLEGLLRAALADPLDGANCERIAAALGEG